jgi:CARDB
MGIGRQIALAAFNDRRIAMRGTRISMIALAAAMTLGLGSAAHGESLVLKRDTGVKPVLAAAPSAGSTAAPSGATKLGAPKSQKADLVILPFYNNPNGLPEGFPTESFCVKKASGGAPNQIKFIIRNTGNAPSGNFQWVPMFPTAGAAPAMVQVSLAPGAQKIVTQALPANCYTPGFSGICQFSIDLDTHNEVAESNEANNDDDSFCASPAG